MAEISRFIEQQKNEVHRIYMRDGKSRKHRIVGFGPIIILKADELLSELENRKVTSQEAYDLKQINERVGGCFLNQIPEEKYYDLMKLAEEYSKIVDQEREDRALLEEAIMRDEVSKLSVYVKSKSTQVYEADIIKIDICNEDLPEAEPFEEAETIDDLTEFNPKYSKEKQVHDPEMNFRKDKSELIDCGKVLVELLRNPNSTPASLYKTLSELYTIRLDLGFGSEKEYELLVYVQEKLKDTEIKEIGRRITNYAVDNKFELSILQDYASTLSDGCFLLGIRPVENLLDDRLDFGSGNADDVRRAIDKFRKDSQ